MRTPEITNNVIATTAAKTMKSFLGNLLMNLEGVLKKE
jgi:hypothetical protein